ncbi:MAG: oligoribonuclease [Bdellovibrionia bacterium]
MKKLLWIDLEMTGLDDLRDQILEVAAVITDWDLSPLEEYHAVVFQSEDVLSQMNDWCKKTHGESGLTQAVSQGKPLTQVETELAAFALRHFKSQDRIVLAGNSIWNDRRFIDRCLPQFARHLHYRMIDVSSFKEVYREKYNLSFQKKNTHRALDDIQESISELKFYLSFVQPQIKPAQT